MLTIGNGGANIDYRDENIEHPSYSLCWKKQECLNNIWSRIGEVNMEKGKKKAAIDH